MRGPSFTTADGITGWSADGDELLAYGQSVCGAWQFWARLWMYFRPPVSEKIAFSNPDGGVVVLTPDPILIALLRTGGVIRHMRVIGQTGQVGREFGLFEGTGEIMGPMTHKEALEFVAWKDIPRGTNHIAVIDGDTLPKSRDRRDKWVLSGDGRIVEAIQ